jgi:hypothetical protein
MEQQNCAICLENLIHTDATGVPVETYETACKHTFHQSCFAMLLCNDNYDLTCPSCRAILPPPRSRSRATRRAAARLAVPVAEPEPLAVPVAEPEPLAVPLEPLAVNPRRRPSPQLGERMNTAISNLAAKKTLRNEMFNRHREFDVNLKRLRAIEIDKVREILTTEITSSENYNTYLEIGLGHLINTVEKVNGFTFSINICDLQQKIDASKMDMEIRHMEKRMHDSLSLTLKTQEHSRTN